MPDDTTPSADTQNDGDGPLGLPRWVTAVLPVVLLALLVGAFVVTSPLSGIESGQPLPDVTVTHATMPGEETIVLHVTNNGPDSVTIAQVLMNEAYWQFDVSGDDRTLAPLESARVVVPYHWNPGWDVHTTLVLSDGATVAHTIVAPYQSPGFSLSLLWTLALVGVFVGVIPVLLGMLWFPYIRSMSDRSLHAVLLFAVGVLGFLAVDAAVEAFDVAKNVPGMYEGRALVVLGIVGALFLVQAVSSWRDGRAAAGDDRAKSGLWIAYLVALSIGLHNLAEGLAIGSAFALGHASLGTFLILGFMLHNVTEGPAVVAPVAREGHPAARHFVGLGVLAGAPVIFGGWLGSLAYSPVLGAFFLAVGVGAILQVNWEITQLVRHAGGRVASATNLLAALAGFALMYTTDLLVAL